MTKIFKNMAPYWYMIVAIVLLLIVQAFGRSIRQISLMWEFRIKVWSIFFL